MVDWINSGGDISWIIAAFITGFIASRFGLPPLIGYLVAGFGLANWGVKGGAIIEHLSDIGVTLLLFSIGLKLQLKTLLRPEVWLVTSMHSIIMMVGFAVALFGLGYLGAPLVADLGVFEMLLIGFALSFSSTVFVVKVLESRGESKSIHGSVSLGILVMQDVLAVVFLAFSAGYIPSPWAILLLLLIPMKQLLNYVVNSVGHGELLLLLGFTLSLGGALLFESFGMKGDLGALLIGMLLANHERAGEFAKAMLGFKELFLVGFFLSVGLSGNFSIQALTMALILLPLLVFKAIVFFLLLSRFKLGARNSLLASISLTNFSEFGLIVVAVCVSKQWLASDWLVVIAMLLSLSFLVMTPFNERQSHIYQARSHFWRRFQKVEKLPWDTNINLAGMSVAIFGMGRVGTGAYDKMVEHFGTAVVGFDFDQSKVDKHLDEGRQVIQGNPADPDFWEKIEQHKTLEMVLLATPYFEANVEILQQLRLDGYQGKVAAVAHYPDEDQMLKDAGADEVFNIYAEAGNGFAEHVSKSF